MALSRSWEQALEKLEHQSVDTNLQDVPLVYLSDHDNPDVSTTPL